MKDFKICPTPWHEEVTMSSDFRHIRRIADDEDFVIADIRYIKGVDQEVILNHATLFKQAPSMLNALQRIIDVLSDHPEANAGNSKVHYAIAQARNELRALKGRS